MQSSSPALEKNILKYRAFQMVLLLHQVESLRAHIIGSIRGTDRLRRAMGTGVERLSPGTKKPMEKALALLVQENILTQKESQELQDIIGLRNKIGHAIHELVQDISAPELFGHHDPVFDYFALKRFEQIRQKVSIGMRTRFVLQIDFRELSFEKAEETYREELMRLQKRIQRQLNARRGAA
jgi:hypothetical protein